ncbi:MAG: SEC-C metal-binding domain-containing protein [Bacilli bacterium]
MPKIGRNDPCPCGSGKKFKKCCIDKAEYRTAAAAPLRTTGEWTEKRVAQFSTEEIFRRLRGMGIVDSQTAFMRRMGSQRILSEVVSSWGESLASAIPQDIEFAGVASLVLWRRYAAGEMRPEDPRLLEMRNWFDEGYQHIEHRRLSEACRVWMKVWERVLEETGDLDSAIHSVAELEVALGGPLGCSLYNWCQDFELELGNAAIESTDFVRMRLDYARSFAERFPKSEDSVLVNMGRAEGESLFLLGRAEEGDAVFEALAERFPSDEWVYIGWGDQYSPEFTQGMKKERQQQLQDAHRARELYQRGLANVPDAPDAPAMGDMSEKEVLTSRLELVQQWIERVENDGVAASQA